MKQRITIVILCLAWISLACLDTSASVVAVAQPTLVATRITDSTPASILEPVIISTVTTEPQLCAVVSADTALHLRIDAGARARILANLSKGDVLHVINQKDPAWWFVTRGGYIGFVKSSYLQEVECVK